MENLFITLGICIIVLCGLKIGIDYLKNDFDFQKLRQKFKYRFNRQERFKQGGVILLPSDKINVDKIEKEANRHDIDIEDESSTSFPIFSNKPSGLPKNLPKNFWIHTSVIIAAGIIGVYLWKTYKKK